MATLIARAFGSIISAISYCFFGYRDNKKSVSNINYYNMPKGRPLSLQVPFHPPMYILFFDPSRYLNFLPSPFTMAPHLQLAKKTNEKKKKNWVTYISIHRHHLHDANLPNFPFYLMDYIYIYIYIYIFSIFAFSFPFVRPLWMSKQKYKTLQAFLHKREVMLLVEHAIFVPLLGYDETFRKRFNLNNQLITLTLLRDVLQYFVTKFSKTLL